MTQIGRSNPEHRVQVPGRADLGLTLAWSAATDVGRKRRVNEDSFLAQCPLFVVADGMGGHTAGDLASTAVVTRLAEVIDADTIEPDAIEEALATAARDIDRIAGDSTVGAGTTVTGAAVAVVGGETYFAVFNIGDSRTYRLYGDVFEQITVDHSVVQELVDAGAITKEQAEQHPDSNVITRAIGFHEVPVADFWLLPAVQGLRLLICSDGLTKEVPDADLRWHLARGLSARETAHALVDDAVSRGGRDNVTVVVVDVLGRQGSVDIERTVPRHRTL